MFQHVVVYMFISVNGNWGDWSKFGSCSATCGTGTQTRTRRCDHPAPSDGGKTCDGEADEAQDCNTRACPGELLNR